ncbi:MAG: DUF1349 domain-containing protein [Acidobacteriota bacterium]
MSILIAIFLGLAWTPSCQAQGSAELVFSDDFSDDEVHASWSWLHGTPLRGWELSNGQLKLRTKGRLWQDENTQRNLLLTQVPPTQVSATGSESGFTVEVTVRNDGDFTERYEHGGLIWYWDDDNWVTLTQLNHVQHKTQKIMLVHEVEGDGRAQDSQAEPYTARQVTLRLVVEGRVFTGFYRATTEDAWTKLGLITFPNAMSSARVGLAAGDGPDTVAHWVTFDDFRLLRR